MQFINIVVHSVEDMNFRVHLQYEFTKLGLDEYLDVSMIWVSTASQRGSVPQGWARVSQARLQPWWVHTTSLSSATAQPSLKLP